MMKRFGMMLLMLCLLVLPAAAMALEVKIGDVVLPNGKYMASGGNTVVDTKPSGGYAYLKDGVLTLKDYSISGYFDQAITVIDGKLEIRLEGENSLTNKRDDQDGIASKENAEIKVSGSGSVTIDADYGIYGYNNDADAHYGKVSIAGGKVMIKSHYTAIYAEDIIISGGELTAEGEYSSISVDNLTISGGKATLEGEYGYIFAGNAVISGGTVKVVTNEYSAFEGGQLSISGTDTVVDFTAGKNGGAIYTWDNLEIASPLQILTPQDGVIRAGGDYCTILDADGNVASRVYIAAGSSGAASLPQTGDHSAMMLWAMLACLAGAGALLLRRREEN